MQNWRRKNKMAILKNKDIKGLSKEEKSNKLKDLRFELIKAKAKKSSQGVSLKTKEIKRTIARILTHINLTNISKQ